MIRHAGLVALRRDGVWTGALIEGASGSGKSDLALRAIDSGLRLVSDDRTLLWASGGVLYGRAPDSIAGLIEARGVGVFCEPAVWLASVAVIVRCLNEAETIERLPELATEVIAGIATPTLNLRAADASAPAKIRRAIEYLGRGDQQAYLAPSLGGQNRAGTGDTL